MSESRYSELAYQVDYSLTIGQKMEGWGLEIFSLETKGKHIIAS